MTRVWERLFVAGIDDAEKLATANPFTVTTVLSVCRNVVWKRVSDINYVQIPISDSRPIPVGKFDSIMDALAENIRWGTVLLHCFAGLSRAPILTAAWMHITGYKSIEAAMLEIAELRRTMDPSPVLLNSVKELL